MEAETTSGLRFVVRIGHLAALRTSYDELSDYPLHHCRRTSGFLLANLGIQG